MLFRSMSEVTGNFEAAIHEASRVLNVRGTILPSTLEDVTLSARTHEDEEVHGEHNITERGAQIKDLFIHPGDAAAHPDAVRAILDADIVLIGPGSLYTSVMPNLLVPGIHKALAQTLATKVFICNVATQHGETDGFGVAEHIEAIERHTASGILNVVIANNNILDVLPEAWHSSAVTVPDEPQRAIPTGVRLIQADVVAEENRYRHDPQKLAATIMRLYDGRDIQITDARRVAAEEQPVLLSR